MSKLQGAVTITSLWNISGCVSFNFWLSLDQICTEIVKFYIINLFIVTITELALKFYLYNLIWLHNGD